MVSVNVTPAKPRITIGADPELFIFDNKAGRFVSAHGFFPGTKSEPFAVECGAVQVDGVALEFNINPAKTEDEFFKNIDTVMTQMTEMVTKVNKDWELRKIPYVTFDKKTWDGIPAEAKVLGCDPDYNYLGNINIVPNIADKAIRTAAGHTHLGWCEGEDTASSLHMADCKFIAQNFYTSGIYAPKLPEENNRLSYYGNYGAFRPKSYGIELRSPSNLWLRTEKEIREHYRKTVRQFEIAVPA